MAANCAAYMFNKQMYDFCLYSHCFELIRFKTAHHSSLLDDGARVGHSRVVGTLHFPKVVLAFLLLLSRVVGGVLSGHCDCLIMTRLKPGPQPDLYLCQ